MLAQKLAAADDAGRARPLPGQRAHRLISLVDPDNRRPVDFAPLDGADSPKTLLVRRVLQLRHTQPELFRGYRPVEAGRHAVAFHRADDLLVVVVTRPIALQHEGFGDATLDLDGAWTDVLTGARASTSLHELVGDRPGALLVRS